MQAPVALRYAGGMERIGMKTRSFEEAEQWDREQSWAMTVDERFAILKLMHKQVYGEDIPDVRAGQRRP